MKRILGHPLTRNTASLGVLQFANYVVPLVVLPYLAWRLTPEGLGIVAIAFSVAHLGFVLCDYGYVVGGPYRVARAGSDRVRVARLAGGAIALQLCLWALALALTLALVSSGAVASGYHGALLLAMATVLCRVGQLPWLFQGLQRMWHVTRMGMIVGITYMALVLLLVRSADDFALAILAHALANLAGTVYGLVALRREGVWPRMQGGLRGLAAELRESAPYFLSRIAVAGWTNGSVVLLGTLGTATQAAVFYVAQRIYVAITALARPLIQALYPFMVSTRDFRTFGRVVLAAAGVTALVALVIGLAAPWLVEVAFGAGYAESVTPLRLLLVNAVVNVVGVSIGYPLLGALDRTDAANRSVWLGLAVYAGAIAALAATGWMSPVSVAMAFLATETAITVYRASVACRILGGRR